MTSKFLSLSIFGFSFIVIFKAEANPTNWRNCLDDINFVAQMVANGDAGLVSQDPEIRRKLQQDVDLAIARIEHQASRGTISLDQAIGMIKGEIPVRESSPPTKNPTGRKMGLKWGGSSPYAYSNRFLPTFPSPSGGVAGFPYFPAGRK